MNVSDSLIFLDGLEICKDLQVEHLGVYQLTYTTQPNIMVMTGGLTWSSDCSDDVQYAEYVALSEP